MIGQTISHYRILAKLGEGGMGVVYKAEDLDLKVTRALKFLPPHTASDEGHLARLKHEARAAAALEHPNICQVHEIGRDKGQTFIVMSFLEGRTLEERLSDEGPLPIAEAMAIATEVGDALKRAHAAGIIHRDIKPANIMLTEGGQAVVMDFGLAKAADQTRLTKTGTTLGTAAYMSPEQIQGESVDARADLWALGVLLYEMVTGQVPFAGENLPAVAYAVRHTEPASPAGIRSEVSADLERVLDRTLAKDPQQRYQTTEELVGDLVAVRDEQNLARKTAMYDRRQKLKRRKSMLFGSLAVLVVVAAALIWWNRHQDLNRIDALAVLPFANLSGDVDQEFFSDGMTDALITELQQLAVDKIRVISRTSVMQYKETDLSLPEIASELGVDALVEASVIRSGEFVKIAAKLIRARPEERQIWAETYEKDIRDILILHEQLGHSVMEHLGLIPESEKGRVAEVDPAAYEEYLIGAHIMNSSGAVSKALPHFEKAIEIDPSFAAPYAYAAHCKVMPMHAWPFLGDVEEARQLAEKCIELDPEYAFGHYILGHILYEHEFRFQEAGRAFDRAYRINPSHGLGLITYAYYLKATGKFAKAGDVTIRAIRADPFNFLILRLGASAFLSAGRIDDLVAEVERVRKIDPEIFPSDPDKVALVPFIMGDYRKALEIVETYDPPENPDDRENYSNELVGASRLQYVAVIKWCAGQVEEARAMARHWFTIEEPDSISQTKTAEIHAILGDYDQALTCLEKAYEDRDILLVRIQDPTMSALPVLMAGEPRYDQFLKNIGMRE